MGIQAEDLRIGNIVHDKHLGELTINALSERGYNGYYSAGEYIDFDYEDIFGIPLTEEWLVRLGFEKQELSISHNTRLYVCIDGGGNYANEGKLLVLSNGIPYLSMPCKYVHQLQNLYYALTGTELTIK